MAKLQNVFSWSFSSASDFEECRRRRYWAKYGMWGGWDKNAPETARRAYQLSKMDNIYSLRGTAAELGAMWALRKLQNGKTVTVEEAYREGARPYLNAAWQDSKEKKWRINPKRHCCLREHYYRQWDPATEKEKTVAVISHVKTCITNFIEKVWPRLQEITIGDELFIAGPEDGDPEHFMYEDIKIYAIPDYAYHKGEQVHIHDWKSGRIRPEHRDQLCLYGLWAHTKLGKAPEQIIAYDEYLGEGKVAFEQLKAEDLEQVRQHIVMSVADMADYLEDGDIRRNEPLPKEEWELVGDQRICQRCNFHELCKDELEEM